MTPCQVNWTNQKQRPGPQVPRWHLAAQKWRVESLCPLLMYMYKAGDCPPDVHTVHAAVCVCPCTHSFEFRGGDPGLETEKTLKDKRQETNYLLSWSRLTLIPLVMPLYRVSSARLDAKKAKAVLLCTYLTEQGDVDSGHSQLGAVGDVMV
ncbi:hypothetical protein J3F83DRAFT_408202 [Trichoderma novae-zelandiae]